MKAGTMMAMKKTGLLVVILGAACSPARAGAPEKKPVAIATADPVVTAATASSAAPGSTAIPAASPAPVAASKPIQAHKDRMRWIEGPPAIPRSRMTVLEGNPKVAGAIFTIRLSVNAGVKIAPHHHPQDERVTVLEGSVLVGFGDVADDAKAARMKAGDFYVNPAGSHHFVSFDEPAVFQITGIGPWEVIPVVP